MIYDKESDLYYDFIERASNRGYSPAILSLHLAKDSPTIGYDVVRLKKGKLPTSEVWGKRAWSFNTLELAKIKYSTLLKR